MRVLGFFVFVRRTLILFSIVKEATGKLLFVLTSVGLFWVSQSNCPYAADGDHNAPGGAGCDTPGVKSRCAGCS